MSRRSVARRDPTWFSTMLLVLALLYFAIVLLLPFVTVFVEALRKGFEPYFTALQEPDAVSAMQLTLLVAAIAVPLNTVFGLTAAWAVAKFEFKGKSALLTLIDIPFSISPVISGLVFVLLYGAQGWFGAILDKYDVQIIFTVTGLVLATTLVTLPFVARELIPLMQAQGSDEEVRRRHIGRGAVAHLLFRDTAEHSLGADVWRAAVHRSRDGRVRRRLGGVGGHSR